MSQIITSTPLEDVLMLNMIASSSSIASGGNYDLEVGDNSKFQVTAQRGTSITVNSSADTAVTLKSGLYEIIFNGWVQMDAAISGSLDYQFKASSNSAFILSDVAFDRNIQFFGSSATVQPIIDPSHTVLFNTTGTDIYFRITCTNGNSQTWILRGDVASILTTLQIRRIGDAVV